MESGEAEFFQVCFTTSEELAELPFYETDIKELFKVCNQVNAERSCKRQRPKRKYKLTQEMEKKSSAAAKIRRTPPNYFVSIPITNQQILDKIEDVQELVVTKEPKLLPAVVPAGRMHLTIIVAHLATPAEVENAVSALQQCKSKVDAILEGKPLNLQFQGIGQFNDQVLFAKLSDDTSDKVKADLKAVAETVEILFRELGVNIEDSNEFKPHATFLKLSKSPALRRKGFRKICPDLYKEYQNAIFGTEVLARIDLCSMIKKKQPSGYYHCESSINVGNSGVARALVSPEESAKQMEPEMSFGSEDHEEESMVSALHLTELSAIEPADLQGSVQSPSRSPLPHDAFVQVNQPLTTNFTHVQKEGFNTIHDDLVDLKGIVQSSLEVTQATIQNIVDLLPSTIQTEPEKGSALSGLSATQTEMQELKCIMQSGMEQLEKSVQSGFAELNSNISGLSQNIADLVNILTLIHTCNPADASCQNI
ncbi:A-kinase anchor protein 7-like [Cetorhinus maximus]